MGVEIVGGEYRLGLTFDELVEPGIEGIARRGRNQHSLYSQ